MPDDTEHDSDQEGLEPTGYRSGRVRIVGAQPAGTGASDDDFGMWPTPDEDAEAEEIFSDPKTKDFEHEGVSGVAPLPHWTEPPTGEVPAILSRAPFDDESSSDPWSSLPAPAWREGEADWQAGEDTFEPSMLAHADETRLGSLDDSGLSDRQPWAFDLPGPQVDDEWADDPDGFADLGSKSWSGGPSGGWTAQGGGYEPLSVGEDLDDEATITASLPVVDRGAPDVLGSGSLDAGQAGSPGRLSADRINVPDVDEDLPLGPKTRIPKVRLPRSRDDSATDGEPSARRFTRLRQPASQSTPRTSEPPSQGAGRRNVGVAVGTGVLLGAISLVAFKVGTVASLVVLTAVVTLAAAEAYAAFRQEGYHPVTLMGLVATLSVMIATYNKGEAALPLVLILLFAFSLVWYLAGVERTDAVRGTATTLLVFCWIGAFGSFGALLLSPALFPERHGIAFLLGAVIASVSYDVGALAIGSWLGRHPLAPSVSPNKTWEGFIGGAITCLVITVAVVHAIHPWTVGKAADLGLVVAVVSPIGDLCESLVKRQLGRKDMGRLLPGHGGMLDRIDGLLFVLPATFYLIKALHLG